MNQDLLQCRQDQRAEQCKVKKGRARLRTDRVPFRARTALRCRQASSKSRLTFPESQVIGHSGLVVQPKAKRTVTFGSKIPRSQLDGYSSPNTTRTTATMSQVYIRPSSIQPTNRIRHLLIASSQIDAPRPRCPAYVLRAEDPLAAAALGQVRLTVARSPGPKRRRWAGAVAGA